jgi:hypothetical protein
MKNEVKGTATSKRLGNTDLTLHLLTGYKMYRCTDVRMYRYTRCTRCTDVQMYKMYKMYKMYRCTDVQM